MFANSEGGSLTYKKTSVKQRKGHGLPEIGEASLNTRLIDTGKNIVKDNKEVSKEQSLNTSLIKNIAATNIAKVVKEAKKIPQNTSINNSQKNLIKNLAQQTGDGLTYD